MSTTAETTPDAHADTQPAGVSSKEEAKLPNGKAVALTPTAANPGETCQLFLKVETLMELQGFVMGDECELVRVICGTVNVDCSTELAKLRSMKMQPGSFLTVLVKWHGKEPGIVTGSIYVTGDNLPDSPSPAAANPVYGEGQVQASARVAELRRQFREGGAAPSPGPGNSVVQGGVASGQATQPKGPTAIKAGVNEVVVLMQRSEAEVLIQVVKCERTIYAHEQPSLLRALQSALVRDQ